MVVSSNGACGHKVWIYATVYATYSRMSQQDVHIILFEYGCKILLDNVVFVLCVFCVLCQFCQVCFTSHLEKGEHTCPTCQVTHHVQVHHFHYIHMGHSILTEHMVSHAKPCKVVD